MTEQRSNLLYLRVKKCRLDVLFEAELSSWTRIAWLCGLSDGLSVALAMADTKHDFDDDGIEGRDSLASQRDFRQSARATQRLASLGEMTAGLVHDLRNTLAAIDAGLSLAARNAHDPEKVRGYIAMAREAVARRTQAISQLLEFAADREIGIRPGNINALLENIAPFLKYAAGPGIRLVVELADGLPVCPIDSTQFSAAILNLVTNSRDAMPGGGEILIRTEMRVIETASSGPPSPGTYVVVRVKDCGRGMPPDVLRHVLDPFFTTKGEKGTGLGLPQVSTFVRSSGGHLAIASELDVGTTIELLFPCIGQDRA